MTNANEITESDKDAEALKAILKSQYHASLAMLQQAIERCPDELWEKAGHGNPYWKVTYHTLYFVHLYLQQKVTSFRPWEFHQTRIQDLDDYPAPPEIEDLCELPHRPPQTGVPYSAEKLLEYWAICDAMVDDAIDRMDIYTADSGFPWYKFSKLEHQFISLRHIQHHTAQLGDRLRAATGAGPDWVGTKKKSTPAK